MALLAPPALAHARAPGGELKPFGHGCTVQDGVRFCPTVELSERIPSFDGVPLDADVTLPEQGTGPFPTIVIMHGWGSDKTVTESATAAGDGNQTVDYNNVYYAQHGYAVLNYTARGWGRSCGSEESRQGTPACQEGFTRLADTRYEARDTQYLLGLLADEGIAKPRDIGATGGSYGGGQTVELAYLKNRIRLPDGQFAAWMSPKGKKMEIKAAYARAPWSDLIDALEPNGRFLEGEVAPWGQSYEPIGVAIQTYVSFLYAAGVIDGDYYAPAGRDDEADLTKWFAAIQAGEPITPEDEQIARQLYNFHDAYGVPPSGKPAALLLESGWTDDLFPVEQSLRLYEQVRSLKGYAALLLGDVGHPPASNKQDTDRAFNEAGARFFAAKLEHEGKPPINHSVTAYTQTCPTSQPSGGPYSAKTWAALHPRALTFGSAVAQTFTSAGASPTIAAEFDPIAEYVQEAGEAVCQETKSALEPNAATYTMTSLGFLMLGLPTITAHVATTGADGQIDARLWDVLPSGEQRLITRGVYRLSENQVGSVAFQMHGNGYEFAHGDTVKLELLGRDAPYYRASNTPFTVEATDVSVRLPTR